MLFKKSKLLFVSGLVLLVGVFVFLKNSDDKKVEYSVLLDSDKAFADTVTTGDTTVVGSGDSGSGSGSGGDGGGGGGG